VDRYTLRTVVKGKNVDTIYYNKCLTWDQNNYNCLSWSGDSTQLPTDFSTTTPYKTDKNISCTYGNRSDCTYIWENIPKYKDVTIVMI
jgi:type IV pilus assembly protein PilY1